MDSDVEKGPQTYAPAILPAAGSVGSRPSNTTDPLGTLQRGDTILARDPNKNAKASPEQVTNLSHLVVDTLAGIVARRKANQLQQEKLLKDGRQATMLVLPVIPHDIAKTESADIEGFNEATKTAKAFLLSDSSSKQTSKARDALQSLYLLYLGSRRLNLYKYYMTFRLGGKSLLSKLAVEESKDVKGKEIETKDTEAKTKFQSDLNEYSKAMEQYQIFMKGHGAGWDHQSDTHLVQVAAILTAVEIYKEKQQQDDKNSDRYANPISEGRKRAAEYYSQHILDLNDNIIGITAPRTFSDTTEKRQMRAKIHGKRRRYLANLTMALFGGFALIIPMLIMTLHQTRLTTLLTTSLFVVVVAMILSMFIDTAEPKDVLGATAAYAAVLVVFVGTSGVNQDGHLSNRDLAGIVIGSVVGIIILLLFMLWWTSDLWLQREMWLKSNAEQTTEKVKSEQDQHAQPVQKASGGKPNAESPEDRTDVVKVTSSELKDHKPSQSDKTESTSPKDKTSVNAQNVEVHDDSNSAHEA